MTAAASGKVSRVSNGACDAQDTETKARRSVLSCHVHLDYITDTRFTYYQVSLRLAV